MIKIDSRREQDSNSDADWTNGINQLKVFYCSRHDGISRGDVMQHFTTVLFRNLANSAQYFRRFFETDKKSQG